ncbi:MAG: helicase-related protein, partial [Conexivisphaera sp.]
NDMYRNLVTPLNEIKEKARSMGMELPEIRVAIRTSDTSPEEKQRMLRRPPHILITTPESLAISLVAPRFRERLSTARWVIVDEIHELASSKRGSHLALTLERLEELVAEKGMPPLQRIGLSATISPLDVVARFLGGYYDDGTPRPVEIVDARFAKPFDIRVVTPKVDLIHEKPDKINEEIYKTIAELTKTARTTLVFTNTRSESEILISRLRLIDPEFRAEVHHSSISLDRRLDAESRLKGGELDAVICTSSLELGIDVGSINAVIQYGSPRQVTRLIQRVGRSGHSLDRVSRGLVIAVDEDDALEAAVIARRALAGQLEDPLIPQRPYDVLVQRWPASSWRTA